MTYEILIIANSNLDEKAQKELVKEVTDSVTKEEGKVLSDQSLGIKKLATPMKKQETGAYLSLICELESDKINKLAHQIRSNHEIINSFIFATSLPEKKEKVSVAKEVAKVTVKPKEEKKTVAKKDTSEKPVAKASVKKAAKPVSKPKKTVKSDITSEIENEDDRLKKLDDQLDEILKD